MLKKRNRKAITKLKNKANNIFAQEIEILNRYNWNQYKREKGPENTYSYGSWNQFLDPNATNVINRSTGWRNAWIILVDVPPNEEINEKVVQTCEKYYRDDSRRIIVFKEKEDLLMYNGETKSMDSINNIEDAINRLTEKEMSAKNNGKKMRDGLEYDYMQKIFFGAPGTGKSFKVEQITGAPAREHDFRIFMSQDKSLNEHSVGAYINYYKNLYAKKHINLFDYKDEIPHEKMDELKNQDDHWGTVISKYNDFIRQYTELKTKKNVFRTIFHPDYDYAQFVGSYKPTKARDQQGNILHVANGCNVLTYTFVPQVFAKAYVAAWKRLLDDAIEDSKKQVYLVIEEINRGNCAQIFGDIFQLLDRKEGQSEYPIDIDSDFADFIRTELNDKFDSYKSEICSYCDDVAQEESVANEEFCKIALPPNFNILATMNTSDQSLFPMDSAFKRRFDWEYVPIDYKQTKAEFKVSLKRDEGDNKPLEFNWLHFLKKINADISKVTESEDKQMGEFFVKPKNNVIDLDMFRSKVLFYLWDSVYKDAVDDEHKNVFHFHFKTVKYNIEDVTFQHLFGDDARAIGIINAMMTNLDDKYDSKNNPEFKDFLIIESAESQDTQGSNQ